ncbi:hypothetical protein PPTG_23264 [Phytophthora nicotianae INRA-310]|uniref:Uncharacterized protein n=2 Tax=Phytophthora nicotianae TaxID=4792 RepID=W2Q2J0_PHYN3|nr:hypothetical protein PPTG_23264 [Phytophthora nicotianae INRA-310]ETN06764.1 hypothetical protein PPTG_23264 [Phytophthora nicotianae INRA-310]ETO72090.1 hypothetical protein F444_11681 [Phytophthora nicotianae P1976]
MERTFGANDIPPKARIVMGVYLTTLSKERRLRYNTIQRIKKLFQISRTAIEGIWVLRDNPAGIGQPRRPYPSRKTHLSAKDASLWAGRIVKME